METPIYTLNRILNQRAVNDATNADLSAFLIGDGHDADTVAAAIAQLDAHNLTRLQFQSIFGYA